MLLVLLGVCVFLFVISFLMYYLFRFEGISFGITMFTIIVCIIVLFALGSTTVSVINLEVIDDKIAMYQEENTAIEQQIDIVVEEYMRHENDIFSNANNESPIVLVQLYPELKSDALVQQQMEVYLENNEKIKSLKEDKINGSVYRWWLYFGK